MMRDFAAIAGFLAALTVSAACAPIARRAAPPALVFAPAPELSPVLVPPPTATTLRRIATIELSSFGGCAIDRDERAFCWGAPPTWDAAVDSLMRPDRPLRHLLQYPWPTVAPRGAVRSGPGWTVDLGGTILVPGRGRPDVRPNVRLAPDSWDWCTQSDGVVDCFLFRRHRVRFDASSAPMWLLREHACRPSQPRGLRCAPLRLGRDTSTVMNDTRYQDPRIFEPDPAEERGVALDLAIDVASIDERLFAFSDEQACFVSGSRVECVRYRSAPSLLETRPGDAARFEHPVSTLVGGAGFLCALDALGAVWCWGSLASVASGGTAERPQRIDLPVPARALAADARHACVVDTDDVVRCWGERALGRLGDRASPVVQTPTEVTLPSRARAIGIGMNHSCAHLDNGEVHCWGDNTFGQIAAYDGEPMTETLAAGVHAVSEVTRVRWPGASPSATMRVGPWETCACAGDDCKCHGGDLGFALHLSCPIERRSEAAVLGPLDALACGGRHACALARGRVYCWGRNDYWQSAPERGVQRTPQRVMGYRIAQP